jgi:predicted transcriptional regulator
MRFLNYIDKERLTVAKFAKKAGTSAATIYNFLNGRDVRSSVWAGIVKGTKGKVSFEDLYRDACEIQEKLKADQNLKRKKSCQDSDKKDISC